MHRGNIVATMAIIAMACAAFYATQRTAPRRATEYRYHETVEMIHAFDHAWLLANKFANVWLVFDFDETLVTIDEAAANEQIWDARFAGAPDEQWNQRELYVRIAQQATASLAESLVDEWLVNACVGNVTCMILTSRDWRLAEATLASLESLSIDMSGAFRGTFRLRMHERGDTPIYSPNGEQLATLMADNDDVVGRDGVVFATGNHKGRVLMAVWRHLKVMPDAVVFVDNDPRRIHHGRVRDVLNGHVHALHGIRYGRLDKPHGEHWWASIVNKQLATFQRTGRLISNDEAHALNVQDRIMAERSLAKVPYVLPPFDERCNDTEWLATDRMTHGPGRLMSYARASNEKYVLGDTIARLMNATWRGFSHRRRFRILDLGCGDGHLSAIVLAQLKAASFAIEYVCIEAHEMQLQAAGRLVRLLAASTRMVHGSAFNDSLLHRVGCGFDLILASHVVYYQPLDRVESWMRNVMWRNCAMEYVWRSIRVCSMIFVTEPHDTPINMFRIELSGETRVQGYSETVLRGLITLDHRLGRNWQGYGPEWYWRGDGARRGLIQTRLRANLFNNKELLEFMAGQPLCCLNDGQRAAFIRGFQNATLGPYLTLHDPRTILIDLPSRMDLGLWNVAHAWYMM